MIRPYHAPLQCTWAVRTPRSTPADKVTTYVCTDKQHRKLIEEVRGCLSEDLRKPAYRGNPNPVAGHCYIASEALYHTLGGKEAGWTPQNIRHEGGPHWYLKHQDGTILDPTADQFRTPVPYEKGHGCGFLTRPPSARTQVILDRMG